MNFEKFIRFTGMFKLKDNPKCSTATPSEEKLKEFIMIARNALSDGRLIQFSFWDNGTKPNKFGKVMDTLNYREVDGDKEKAWAAKKSEEKGAYTPKVKEIPPEEPLEEPKVQFGNEDEDNW